MRAFALAETVQTRDAVQADSSDRARDPFRILMCAVIEQAIKDLTQPTVNRGVRSGEEESYRIRCKEDAEKWFASNGRYHPYSFLEICDYLDLDAGCVRRAVANPGKLRKRVINLRRAM